MVITIPRKAVDRKLKKTEAFPGIITINKAMVKVLQHVEAVALSSETVLITGETGVGKELIARAIHTLSGRKGRLIAVNVAGLDDNVFSDTLFGHIRGAFTGAVKARKGQIDRATDGTLFLDEIGDLSPASQVKLLRLLQEGEYLPLGREEPLYTDARILTATNVDIWKLQRRGEFRRDLNFRLRTHHINVPPLRERPEDLKPLVEYFLDLAAETLGKERPPLPGRLLTALQSYSFPGNVRELQSMIFDAVSRQRSGLLPLGVFKAHIEATLKNIANEGKREPGVEGLVFPEKLPSLKEATTSLVAEAMKRSGGNQTKAAGMLGISRQAFGKRLKKM